MGKRKSKTYKKKSSKKSKTIRNKTMKKGGIFGVKLLPNYDKCNELRKTIGNKPVTNIPICERSAAYSEAKNLGCSIPFVVKGLKGRCNEKLKYDYYGNELNWK